jgi:hypothetical protein
LITVEDAGSVGAYSSLALDERDNPYISYYRSTNPGAGLKFAYYDGSSWEFNTVFPDPGTGYFNSIALDSEGDVHISYYEDNGDDLEHAFIPLNTLGYEYNRSFPAAGVYTWNVTCNRTAGFYSAFAADTVTINVQAPNVTSLLAIPSPQGFGRNVSIYANVSHPDGGEVIDTVLVRVAVPGEGAYDFMMQNSSYDNYTYNFTDFVNGTYSYTVIANHTSGTSRNASSTFDMYVNVWTQVKTLKDDYYLEEWVNLTDPPPQ